MWLVMSCVNLAGRECVTGYELFESCWTQVCDRVLCYVNHTGICSNSVSLLPDYFLEKYTSLKFSGIEGMQEAIMPD